MNNPYTDIASILGMLFLAFGLVIVVFFIMFNLLAFIATELAEYFINQLI